MYNWYKESAFECAGLQGLRRNLRVSQTMLVTSGCGVVAYSATISDHYYLTASIRQSTNVMHQSGALAPHPLDSLRSGWLIVQGYPEGINLALNYSDPNTMLCIFFINLEERARYEAQIDLDAYYKARVPHLRERLTTATCIHRMIGCY
jgi:hypothetical protein